MKAKNLAADPGKASTSESNSDVRAKQVTRTPAAEAIQLRAYEIYVERGVIHGFDTDDWLQAELELSAPNTIRDGPSTQQASTGKKRGSIMSLTINVREATNATILQIAGRLTLGASGPSLRDTVRGLLDSLRKNIVLDLSGVTYFDSFGLGQLIASNVEATSQGGAIKLLNLNKKTQDLMLLTKLYTVFAIYTDESTALMSFDVAPSHG